MLNRALGLAGVVVFCGSMLFLIAVKEILPSLLSGGAAGGMKK